MLWMERFALMFYFVINVFIYGLDWLLASSVGESVNFSEIKQIFILCLKLTVIVWAIFRAFDYLFGGPLRREIKKGQDLVNRSQFNWR